MAAEYICPLDINKTALAFQQKGFITFVLSKILLIIFAFWL